MYIVIQERKEIAGEPALYMGIGLHQLAYASVQQRLAT